MPHIAKKRFGQNFLVDLNIVKKIVRSAGIQPDETVIEIGPGQGSLTRYLLQKARTVIAIELDRDLIEQLNVLASEYNNLDIVEGDVLKVYQKVVEQVRDTPYIVVANIPYNITGAVIRTMLEAKKLPARIVLMVQREVAQRMIAKQGDMNLLSLSVQLVGSVKLLFLVSPQSFRPRPRVWSAVIEIVPHKNVTENLLDNVMKIAHAGFCQKRKLLKKNLSEGLNISSEKISCALQHVGVKENARAQELSVSQWSEISKLL